MKLYGIDLNVLGTWALVIATWGLAWFTRRAVRDQQHAASAHEEIARSQLRVTQEIARTQLRVTIHMDMEERFDRPAMVRERARLAKLLMAGSRHLDGGFGGATRDEITEAVPEFFESLAILDRLDYLAPDLTYNAFSFNAIYWWAALREWVTNERAAQGGDRTLYEEFQRFADNMLDADARKRQTTRNAIEPSPKQIRDFLEGEAMREEPLLK